MKDTMTMEKILRRARQHVVTESVAQTIRADRCYGNVNNLNLSDIFNILVKEAGRLCDCYAGDIFYELGLLDEVTKDDSILFEQDEFHLVIGIYDCGTRSRSNLQDLAAIADNYRAIYEVEITLAEDYNTERQPDGESTYFRAKLYKVDPHMLGYYYDKEMA